MKAIFFYKKMPQELLDFVNKDQQGSVIREGLHPHAGQSYPRARVVLRDTENFVQDGERSKALVSLMRDLVMSNKILYWK